MAEFARSPVSTESNIHEQSTQAIFQEEKAPATQRQKAEKQFFGKLMNFGVAKFNFSETEKESFFVNLKNVNGQEKTIWGIDLNRAIKESEVKIGQYVSLNFEGKQPITVDKPILDKEGQVNGMEKYDTYRNQWSVREATEKERIHPVLERQPIENNVKNLTEFSHHLFTLNKESREVRIVDKDKQGKPQLHDPTIPKNPDSPAFEIIPHKGFLGNFIVNFKNNYKDSDNLEILAVPISKSLLTAAQEIKESLPGLKINLIKGLETLKEKTGISGIADKTERAFINLPDELQQKLLEKLAPAIEGDNGYTFKTRPGRWQLPNEETEKITFRQKLTNIFLQGKEEDLPKTSFKEDLRNFVHFLKNEDFEYKDLNRATDNQPIRQKNHYSDMQETKFNPDNINWKDAEKLGLTRDLLEKTDNMKKLLNGEKTSLFQGLKGDLGGVKVSIDGKFRLAEDPTGKPTFVFHGVRANLDIPKNYLGYEFSNEDKQNLKMSGNLNKQVTLTDKSTNSEFKAYMGVDKDTNELVAIRADRIKIPNVLKGVTLTDEQKKLLEQGKPAAIAGMKDDKNQEFSATVQIDPAKKGFSFRAVPETAIKETVKSENKIQVAANNDGSKAETVKHIEKVPSQQQKEAEIKKLGRKTSGPKL